MREGVGLLGGLVVTPGTAVPPASDEDAAILLLSWRSSGFWSSPLKIVQTSPVLGVAEAADEDEDPSDGNRKLQARNILLNFVLRKELESLQVYF